MISGRLLLQFLGLLTVILLPYVMTTADFGRLATMLAALSISTAMVEGGLGWFEMRFLAPAWRGGDRERALRIGSTTITLRLLLDLALALLLGIYFAGAAGFGLGAEQALCLGFWVFARIAIAMLALTYLALGDHRMYVGLELLRSVIHLLSLLLGYAAGGFSGALLLLAVSHFLLLLVTLRLLLARFPARPWLASPSLLWRHRSYIAWSAAGALLVSIQLWSPVSLVGMSGNLGEAAVLGISIQILGMVHLLSAGMRQGLMPLIASTLADGQGERAFAWISLLARMVAAVSVTGLLLWFVVSGPLVSILWPADYAALEISLGLVIIAFSLLDIASCNDMLLNLRGYASSSARNLLLGTLVIVGGTLLALLGAGPGLAVKVCAAYVLGMLILAFVSYRSLRRRCGSGVSPLLPGCMLATAWPLGYLAQQQGWLVGLGLVVAYLVTIFWSGFLSASEIASVWRALRTSGVRLSGASLSRR